jgi:hypothetical protein
MSADFMSCFGLRENPFWPTNRPEGANPAPWNRLDQEPLRIHLAPTLKCMFVEAAGRFKKHIAKFDDLMQIAGYSREQPSAGGQSLTFIIRGPWGSGKSTLASYLAARTKEYKLPSVNTWTIIDIQAIDDPTLDLDTTRGRIDATLKQLSGVTAGNFASVMFDDLDGDDEYLNSKLRRLQLSRSAIVFLIVKDKSQFWEKSELKALDNPQLELDYLGEDEAVEYVKGRIKEFRCKDGSLSWANDPTLDAYPFVERDIRNAVYWNMIDNGAGVGAKRAEIAIRNLNMVLAKVLNREKEQRAGLNLDVRTMTAAQVASVLVELEAHLRAIYKRVTEPA